MVRLIVAFVVTLLATAREQAGPVTTAEPVYHGTLAILPAGGSINRRNGNALIKVRRWTFELAAQSHGLYPDQEPIIVAIGEDTFRLEAGALRANRKGNTFTHLASATQVPSSRASSMQIALGSR